MTVRVGVGREGSSKGSAEILACSGGDLVYLPPCLLGEHLGSAAGISVAMRTQDEKAAIRERKQLRRLRGIVVQAVAERKGKGNFRDDRRHGWGWCKGAHESSK